MASCDPPAVYQHGLVILTCIIFINSLVKFQNVCAILWYTMVRPSSEMELTDFTRFIVRYLNNKVIITFMFTIVVFCYLLNDELSDAIFGNHLMFCDCDSEITISSRFTFRPVLSTFYLVWNNITLANIILLTIGNICYTNRSNYKQFNSHKIHGKKILLVIQIINPTCTQPIQYMPDRYIVCVWLLPYCLLPVWLALQWLSHCAPTPSSKSHLQCYWLDLVLQCKPLAPYNPKCW